jgi:hypothetical protein
MSSAINPMIQSMIPTNPTRNNNTMLACVMAMSFQQDRTGHARSFHGWRCEAFETNVRLGFSQVRLALAYLQSVEEVPNVKRPAGKRIERLATASMN